MNKLRMWLDSSAPAQIPAFGALGIKRIRIAVFRIYPAERIDEPWASFPLGGDLRAIRFFRSLDLSKFLRVSSWKQNVIKSEGLFDVLSTLRQPVGMLHPKHSMTYCVRFQADYRPPMAFSELGMPQWHWQLLTETWR